MLQIFRTFQVAGIFILLVFASAVRSATWFFGLPSLEGGILNPWGEWLARLLQSGGLSSWLAGVVLIALLGFAASFLLQHYRLTDAGLLPGFTTVMLGSGLGVWLGYSPLMFGALFIAFALYRLYECYRHQGAALPVFDAGLSIGMAWLIAPGFFWFFPAAVIGLAQLKGFRFKDLLGMLVGFCVPAVLFGVYHLLSGSLDSYLFLPEEQGWRLFQSFFELPSLGSFVAYWPSISLIAVSSMVALFGFGKLTTRRPIQEQRFNRLVYMFLAAGWVAILFSGPVHPWSLAYVLFPTGILLGIWLAELSRKRANTISLISMLLVVAGFLWSAIG